MSMMGCLGVWVTDAVSPEPPAGEYFEINYAVNNTYQIYVSTLTVPVLTVDWGDDIIKTYPCELSVGISLTRYCSSSNPVRIYNPDDVFELTINNAYSHDNLSKLTAINTLVESGFTSSSFTLESGLSTLALFIINSSDLTSLTVESGNTNINLFNAANCASLADVTLPSDLGSGAVELTISFKGCALTETAVNNILILADANYSNLQSLNLSEGSNATPTGLGYAAYLSLYGKGVLVDINEP